MGKRTAGTRGKRETTSSTLIKTPHWMRRVKISDVASTSLKYEKEEAVGQT